MRRFSHALIALFTRLPVGTRLSLSRLGVVGSSIPRRRTTRWISSIIAVACWHVGTATAETITYSYAGTVAEDVAGLFTAGETATVTFSFDSLIADLQPSPSVGQYLSTASSYTISSPTLGTQTTTNANVSLTVFSNTSDGFDASGSWSGTPSDDQLSFALQWRDSSGTAISSDVLPSTAFSPTLFDLFRWGGILVNFATPQQCGSGPDAYECTSVSLLEPTVVPVPLPATVWLLLSGLGVTGGWSLRRRRTSAFQA